jgi:hypothetical protein
MVPLTDAERVVKAPVLGVEAPIAVLLIDPPVWVAPVTVVFAKVPPVTVLPVKVKAAGKDKVTVVVPVEVISFAVPLTAVIAPIEEALIATFEAAVN